MLRVLTLSTLFPDAARPRFGPFVERQTLGIAAHPDVELKVIAPIGVPPWPISCHAHYRAFNALPARETWQGLDIFRPRFTHIPATAGRFDADALARRITPLLAEIRKDFPFDLIDAEFFFPDGPAAVRLGQHFGVPVSIKARGADIHFWGSNPATAQQVREAGCKADGLLSVSQALKDDMVALGIDEARIRVHYTGVDLARFNPLDRAQAKTSLGINCPLITSVGALIPRKGQSILIDALQHLPDATLALIGQGESRDQLEEQARLQGVADRVIFTGPLDHDAIAHWLAAADVMALLSASEGLANAWVEALACGTPIVITEAGGAREVLQDESAGRIVTRTAAASAAAIAAILNNPPAPSACRAVAERFTWPRNTEALYEHFLLLTGK
jgi:glycosyltransferase involved in cell wall biosynthesis